MMAGVMLIFMGVSGLGAAVKFIPYPVTTGFTSGIAVVIFSSQINDFLGLGLTSVPAEFFEKWHTYFAAIDGIKLQTVLLGIACLATLILWPRIAPGLPPLVVMAGATAAAYFLELPVATIGSRFGSIPSMLPSPSFPDIGFDKATLLKMQTLMSPAITIAILAAIESLLSAVVADGMIGGRHRPNIELVAQGVANICSPIMGGIPATGAIARTATNVKSGGRTPSAGVVHALVLLTIMAAAAPLASYVPLCALAAILIVVAYNMAEIHAFTALLRAPRPTPPF